MITKDAFKLKRYEPVFHNWLGECIVLEVIPDFGPMILPITPKGLEILYNVSGMPPGVPYLASDYKQRLKKFTADAQPAQVSPG